MVKKLGRNPSFDDRSKRYSVRRIVDERPLSSMFWSGPPVVLDQGNLSACVGFSWCHWLGSYPDPICCFNNDDGESYYRQAQTLDDWPGENYEGSSILAGAKTVLQRFPGVYDSYYWAKDLHELLLALTYVGPVVLGINWYSNMFEPDHGRLHVKGANVGGHAIMAIGHNLEDRTVTLFNSWGPDWGNNGQAYITYDDIARLLKEDGEACIAVGKKNFSGV